MIKGSFDFSLHTGIDIHLDGALSKITKLTVKAPIKKLRRYTNVIKKGLFHSIKLMEEQRVKEPEAKESTAPEDAKMDGMALLMVIRMYGIDMDEFEDAFRDFLINGGCLANGNVNFSETMFDNLTDHDFDRLFGEYLEIFFLPSLMSISKKT